MKLLLINPPHPSIGSRIPHEHLPPLGLLALGGPLLDAGHEVVLLDADREGMPLRRIVELTQAWGPQAILIGHSGSTSAHPVIAELTRELAKTLPHTWLVYGGVYPTYHWREVMNREPQIDFVVRGEGEETAVELMAALESGTNLEEVDGIVYRTAAVPRPSRFYWEDVSELEPFRATKPRPLISDLDRCRIGWELIDFARYSYWGDRRAVVVQFSRGCPHHCSYCGQRGFWERWRHRNPERFAAELARLHREHAVEVVNFADENPTADRAVWKRFLEALIAENVPLILVGSTRAGDIVRDADLMQLYKRAGVARLLMGIESTDEPTLRRICKGSSQATDREAIRVLRRHDIISMAAFVTGFAQENDRDYLRMLRQLLAYDPDQIQAVYATPHAWTAFARQEAGRRVLQTDLGKWDYKHQVLASERVPPWRVLFWMKLTETVMQCRPRSLWRLLAHPDRGFRAAMRWYHRIGRQVWLYELWQWVFCDRRTRHGPTVEVFWNRAAETATVRKQPAAAELALRAA
jgi:anaerobic magnesium-protoporphyrin IX monomethyl ester cyclase